MRHIGHSLGWIALIGLITCDDADHFTITETANTTVEGSFVGQLTNAFGFDSFTNMDITSNQTLQNQGISRHQIDSVFVESLTLTVTETSQGQSFDFLDSITFFVESPEEERKRIGTAQNIPDEGLTEIGLDLDDLDLAPYAAAESMTITTEASGNAPSNDTPIEAEMVLDIDVNVSGVLCGE